MNAKDITGMIDHISGQLVSSIGHVAPQAWATMLTIKHFSSLGYLITAGVWTIISLTVVVTAVCVGLWAGEKADDESEMFTGVVAICSVALVMSVVTFVVNVISLMNYWAWIGLLRPDLAVANDLIQRVLNK